MNPDPNHVFAALHRAAAEVAGVKLFTISVIDQPAKLSRRAYTSHPDAYPVTGTKPLEINEWGRKVIEGKETFVANTTAEFAPYFFDHALINSLGCHSAVNIPVLDGDEVVGTINLLDVEQHFTPERVAGLERIVAASTPSLVAAMKAVEL